ncbi:MAG: hypothetical protein HY367_03860 [Candidatus Aenigmarchaeota archaeon]|nr:hypothetical protein [Candidatus Aenigmarchaeota archaeon]
MWSDVPDSAGCHLKGGRYRLELYASHVIAKYFLTEADPGAVSAFERLLEGAGISAYDMERHVDQCNECRPVYKEIFAKQKAALYNFNAMLVHETLIENESLLESETISSDVLMQVDNIDRHYGVGHA